jgi:hypothetical protein
METNDEIKTEEEVTPAQAPTGGASDQVDQSPTPTDPPEETVGEIMARSGSDGIKFWVIIVSALIYAAGVVYAEVHGLTMLSKGVAPDMRIWAYLGMVAAGISAVSLPIALKVWTIEARQRLAAYMFYALDFAFLCFNAFTDFNTNAGQQLAPWAQSYVTYVLPASPIIVAAFWALIWELDPSVREKVQRLTLRMAMKEKLTRRVAEAAKGQNVNQVVNAAAEREVERALTELFGHPVYRVDMPNYEPPRGLLQSFFGYLSSRARQALSDAMTSRSQPSSSQGDTPKE